MPRGAPIQEKDLIARIVAGDTESYAVLVREHQAYAYRLCLLILGGHHDAEDAAQASFFKAFQALPRFQGQASFRTWLTRILVNTCKDRLRQRRRQKTQSLDALQEAGAPLPPALISTEAPAPAFKLADLETLSPGERDLLALLQSEELSYAQLGQRLGLSLDGVKGRLKRAREKLRHFLRPPGV